LVFSIEVWGEEIWRRDRRDSEEKKEQSNTDLGFGAGTGEIDAGRLRGALRVKHGMWRRK
jgi:hypothetical protein